MNNNIVKDERLIVNQTDILLYFEVIKNTQADTILDVGMFLKRIGAIARSTTIGTIDESVLLDGVELMPDIDLPHYETVYNHIYSLEQLLNSDTYNIHYRLAFALNISSLISIEEEVRIYNCLPKLADYVVTDADSASGIPFLSSIGNMKPLTINQQNYLLIRLQTKED